MLEDVFFYTGLSDDIPNASSTVVLVNTIILINRVPNGYVTLVSKPRRDSATLLCRARKSYCGSAGLLDGSKPIERDRLDLCALLDALRRVESTLT